MVWPPSGARRSAGWWRELEQLVTRNARCEEAMRRAIELMGDSEPRGRRTWLRDDLYEELRPVAECQVTFVDTNVLAYAHDRSEARKQPVARGRLEALWHSRPDAHGGGAGAAIGGPPEEAGGR